MEHHGTHPPRGAPGAEAASATTAEELAVCAQKGSLAAYSELVARFESRLFNFLVRRVRSRSDAEDLTQESFVRAWEHIHRYDPAWRFSTWLFTIAARLAVSHLRRRTMLTVTTHDRAGPDESTSANAEHERSLGATLWRLASEALGEDQHTALWLRYAENMSISEIATVMRKSHVGVRVCLFRARQALANALAQSEGPVAGTSAGPGPEGARTIPPERLARTLAGGVR